ncbi:MAG TPA: 50S ribosomal protein L33 [Candidatus Magasanikbacteria bacterium]|nr:50S ribosomal protein L33 [Candidatus Magasanikbacteria bacterium]
MASKSKERKNRKKMKCSECGTITYFTRKNVTLQNRLELNKHCKHCGKHTLHKETK